MLAWKEAIGRKVNVLSSLRYEGVGAGELPEPFDARLGFDLSSSAVRRDEPAGKMVLRPFSDDRPAGRSGR
jgi:hypothetical protein